MNKPVFVVLRKFYHASHGSLRAFSSDGADILLFDNYDVASKSALQWCERFAKSVSTLCDIGELPESACQIDNLVMQCVGQNCFDVSYMRVGCEIYQKYVL